MPKRKRLITIFSVIFLAGFLLVNFIQQQYVAPILMYHSVNPYVKQGSRLTVSVQTFERQMRFLKNRHYNVITLETLGDLIKNKKKIPAKTLAITFDDGYKDNYTYAFPILKKYNINNLILLKFVCLLQKR